MIVSIDKDKTVFIPVGSIENHGPSLPLETDSLIAEAFCRKFADKTSGIVMPTVQYGVCPGTDSFPGTVSISHSVFMNYLEGVCLSTLKNGYRNVMIVGIHSGNDAAIRTVVEKIFMETRIPVYYINPYTFMKNSPDPDLFAGRSNSHKEASLLLAAKMILGVDSDEYVGSEVNDTTSLRPDELTFLRKHGTVGFSYYTESGHISPCNDADIEAGLMYFKRATDLTFELAEKLRAHIKRNAAFFGDETI